MSETMKIYLEQAAYQSMKNPDPLISYAAMEYISFRNDERAAERQAWKAEHERIMRQIQQTKEFLARHEAEVAKREAAKQDK